MKYADRQDAGRRLARHLGALRGADVVVLGLPRGGVPVAAEVAAALGAPLDVVVVRKIGCPYQPELAVGAIGEAGVRVLDERVLRLARVSPRELAEVEAAERAELTRRLTRFSEGGNRVPLAGRTALIVDDGMATGATARAACQVARARGAARVVLASPVASREAVALAGRAADEVICPWTPQGFRAVGRFYRDFEQTTDDEVVELLRRSRCAESG